MWANMAQSFLAKFFLLAKTASLHTKIETFK